MSMRIKAVSRANTDAYFSLEERGLQGGELKSPPLLLHFKASNYTKSPFCIIDLHSITYCQYVFCMVYLKYTH